MIREERYPTWLHVRHGLYISEEQMDGTPDFYLERDRHCDTGKFCWWVKWRTSAQWSGPYKSAREAMRAVEKETDNEAH